MKPRRDRSPVARPWRTIGRSSERPTAASDASTAPAAATGTSSVNHVSRSPMRRVAKTIEAMTIGPLDGHAFRDERRAQEPGPEDGQDDELDDGQRGERDDRRRDDRPQAARGTQGERAEQAAGEDDDGGDADRQQALGQRPEGRDHELERRQRQVAVEAIRDGLDEPGSIEDQAAEDQDEQRWTGGDQPGQERAATGRGV